MKKVLFCASRASHILNFHLPYIEYLHSLGFLIDVAVQGEIKNKMIHKCFNVKFTKNLLAPDNIKTVFELKKIISQNKYDIVCSNTTLAGVSTRLAIMTIKKNKPYLVHISHGYMFNENSGIKSKIYLFFERITKSPVNDLVVMNKEDYNLAEKYHLGKNLHYIYGMGVDSNKFPQISKRQRDITRENIGINKDNFTILCVGEFSKRKNQTMIINAFNEICKKHKNVILVFAGDGKTFNECKDLAERYELKGKVKFLGHITDINSLYRSCNILVSASQMEGLPFNVMESLLCGLPVVLSDIKGHNDLIQHKQNGLLFEKNNLSELVKNMDIMISDKELYEHIKSNTYLSEEYMVENAKPQLLKILDKK